MTVPYAHNNLGEETYSHGTDVGEPDRYIDFQSAHVSFYNDLNGPTPYPA